MTLDDFVAAERRDLGLRGLMGQLPMHALAPGRHDLVLAWNPDGPETGRDRRRCRGVPRAGAAAPLPSNGWTPAPVATSCPTTVSR